MFLYNSPLQQNNGDGILPCEYENHQNPTRDRQFSSMLPSQPSENAVC